jgi:quinol monooxygenase YgiN
VTIIVQNEADVATFEKAFQPLADFVAMDEPGTISYGYAQSDSDPRRILIFERYASKSAYLDVHKASKHFLTFRPQLAALNAKIEGHSYYEGGLGFV